MPRVSSVAGWRRSAQSALRMTPEGTHVPQGKIEVSPHAIATLAGRAVAQCYGVVGVAAPRTRFGKVELLAPERYSRGVVVRFGDDHISIDVHVVLEHGLRISEVARSIMETVKFAVERPLGLRVVQVNVNVLALRVDAGE